MKFLKYFHFRSLILMLFIMISWRAIDISLKRDYAVIWADTEGYYIYLPALFINGGFENIYVKTTGYFPIDSTNNNRLFNKYPYGVALMQTPFFLVTHYTLKILKPEIADGYDRIYHKAIRVSTFFYVLIGLYILYLSLKLWFNKNVSAISAFAIYAGTNLFFYSTYTAGLSHPYSFCLLAVLLYLTQKIHSQSGLFRHVLLYALILGLAVVVRPTNLLFLAFTLFFPFAKSTWRETLLKFFQTNKNIILYTLAACAIFGGIQIGIWSYMKSDTIVYSYGREGFRFWLSPKIHWVWFDKQNGLFLYSPLLLISLCGLIAGCANNKYYSRSILFIFLALSYTFGSWWYWWFGGAFGHRCFVEWNVLMAIPFAFVTRSVLNSKSWIKVIYFLIVAAFIFYSIQMAYAYSYPWEGPDWTWEKYWKVVKTHVLFNG